MTEKAAITPKALAWMNVPKRLWGASFLELPEEHKKPVFNYFKLFHQMLDKGTGFFLYGPAGAGKTSMAVVILKGAWERQKTCYFTTVKELRHAIREEQSFDGSESIMERCRNVDVLVLDDLGEDDFKPFVLGIGEIEHLLNNRSMRSKTTILTTRISIDHFRLEYPSILQTMEGSFVGLLFTDDGRKSEASKTLYNLLMETP